LDGIRFICFISGLYLSLSTWAYAANGIRGFLFQVLIQDYILVLQVKLSFKTRIRREEKLFKTITEPL